MVLPDERPITPTTNQDIESGVHVTPSKSVNGNGKRSMTTSTEPRPLARHRQGSHLKDARNVLSNWRLKTVRNHYTPGPFTLAGFMPDSIVKTLASLRHINSLEAMHSTIQWTFTDRHGEEVIEVLRKLDTFVLDQRESAKRARAAERSAATEARQLEKRIAEDRVREENRRERERLRQEKQANKENEKQTKLAARQKAAAEKLAMKPPPKRARRTPLAGVMTLNVAMPSSDWGSSTLSSDIGSDVLSTPPSFADSPASAFSVYKVNLFCQI